MAKAKISPQPYKSRYPWTAWLGAVGTVTCKRGRQFHGAPHGFQKTVVAAAKRYDAGVRVTIPAPTVVVIEVLTAAANLPKPKETVK